ncbi:MAG: sensor histidine kinase, partial [Oscillospiraceae bacterium]
MKWKAKKAFINLFKNMSISARLTAFLVLFTAVPILLVFNISKIYTTQSFNRYTGDFVEYTNSIISKTMTSLFGNVNTVAFRFIQNRELYNILGNENLSYEEKNERFQTVASNIIGVNSFIKNADIVDTKGNIYSYRVADGFPKISYGYIENIEKSSQLIRGNMISDINGEKYLMLGRNMRSFNTNFNLGSIILYVNENKIYETYKNTSTAGSFTAILDSNGFVISSDYKGIIGTQIKDIDNVKISNYVSYNNKRFLLYKHPIIDEFGTIPEELTAVNIIPQNNLWNMINTRDIYLNLMQIIILLIACFFIVYIFKKIIEPITTLKHNMKRFGMGEDIKYASDCLPRDEIKELEDSFYNMVDQIKNLMRKNEEEVQKQRESELKALQAQINPHFIYNALDSISFMAKKENQKGIENAIYALASFFRISLHKGDKFITVKEEIKHVKSYLAIETIRSGNAFDVEFDIDDDILDEMILKIILQPLVENAIKHGFVNKKDGLISILGYEAHDKIHLEVIDNGCGFDINILNKDTTKGSYGIRNVNERIALEYGDEYG